MREWTGPVRAGLMAGRRRRATWFLLAGAIAVFGITAYSSFGVLARERRLATTSFDPNTAFGGSSCTDSVCHYVDRSGREIGPAFPADDFGNPEQTRQQLDEIMPELKRAAQEDVRTLEREFNLKNMLIHRARTIGTLWGAIFAIMLGATLFGAESRWSVWRTHLTHEPRRARVLLGKLIAFWLMIAIAFLIVVAAIAAFDAVMRVVFDVHGDPSGVSASTILTMHGRALLSIETYGTLAAALAVIARSGVISLGAPLALLVIDGLVVRRYEWLRVGLPAQQIARLLPGTDSRVIVGSMWWPEHLSKVVCESRETFGSCRIVLLPRIPTARAGLVLLAWIIGLVLAAVMAIRSRDVPQ